MSIATPSRIKAACSCGKKYLVRPEFAGKRGKCKCGKVFTVPPQEPPEPTLPKKMCPWCGVWIASDESACESCEREAATRASQQSNPESKKPSEASSHEEEKPWWRNTKTQVIGGISVATVLVTSIYQTQLNGPEFLNLYFGIAVACCVGFVIARLTSGSVAAFVILLVAFETIGAIRYGYGVSQGMHKFGQLAQMMLIGPVGIVLISFLDHFGNSSGGDSSSCGSSTYSSCGSSCGGGGGGGGCGGCGN